MQRLTLLTACALTTAQTGVIASDFGDIKAFTLTGVSSFAFVILPDTNQNPTLAALQADEGQTFKVVGLAKLADDAIMFDIGEMIAGFVLPAAEDGHLFDGDTELVLPLGETLALIATAGLGQIFKAHLVFGDTTKFEVSANGGSNLTVLTLGDQAVGVHANHDKTNVVMLEPTEGGFRSSQILGTFTTRMLAEAIIPTDVSAGAKTVHEARLQAVAAA